MGYKWCIVPQCTNTSIKTPQKVFVSVPTNLKKRKTWLRLARRDPNSISIHTNVFMCEDHFNLEIDAKNYMMYRMGYSQKILLVDKAVPTKFHCQEDCKRRLSDGESSRDVFLKRQKIDFIAECLQSPSATGTCAETLQNDNDMPQKVIEPEELPRTADKETFTDPITAEDKSVQVKMNLKVHYRSKAVQTRCQNKSISTSPIKVFTTSSFTSPLKFEQHRLQP